MVLYDKRFLTSFGMTGFWAESRGSSGDSQRFLLLFRKSGENRHCFPFILTNVMSFRALARNLYFVINYSR